MSNEDNSKKKASSPKKKNTKKKTLKTTGLSGVDVGDVDNVTRLQVEEVIKQAFMRFYDGANIKQLKVKDLEYLNNIVEEFLETYMILGYDLNGEKVLIMHAKNAYERDALVEHLRTTLLGIVNNNNGNN